MLAIGRALMSRPRLLLLDEPSLGLAPFLVQIIFKIIQDINQQGVTVLLVEQNAHQALRIAHRGYVLETGRVVLADTAADLAGILEEIGSDADTGGSRWTPPRTPRPGEVAGARSRTLRHRVGGDVPHRLAG